MLLHHPRQLERPRHSLYLVQKLYWQNAGLHGEGWKDSGVPEIYRLIQNSALLEIPGKRRLGHLQIAGIRWRTVPMLGYLRWSVSKTGHLAPILRWHHWQTGCISFSGICWLAFNIAGVYMECSSAQWMAFCPFTCLDPLLSEMPQPEKEEIY